MLERIRMAVSATCPRRHLRGILLFVPVLLLLCVAPAGAALLQPPAAAEPQSAPSGEPDMVPAHMSRPSLSLLPFLHVYIDVTGEMDVEEVAALPPDKHFVPLDVRRLPHVSGVTWLRFVLDAAVPGQENSAVLLDMGESVPGTPTLYNPLLDTLSNTVEWRENTPTSRNVLLLPRAGSEAQVCFLRLDGLPGLWFSPMLRTPHNAATDLSGLASKSALVALAVVMLLCLLRGLSEHGQWRIWTALYVAAALVQGYFGVPGNGAGHFSFEDAAVLLTPGLALMFLPHVGRHLMQTRGRHRFLDVQFILLVLPGAALALLPLVPDMGWTARYLPLWPLAMLLYVPTATGACLMGLPGARRFLLGILLPPAAVALAVLGLDFGYAPGVLASLPLWGTALSALIIAATAVPRREEESDEGEAPIELTMPTVAQGTLLMDDGPLNLGTPPRPDQLPLPDDPHLRLLPSGEEGIALPRMDDDMPRREAEPAPSRTETPPARPAATDTPDAERLEEVLRRPLDDLMRESAALEQCSLPPSARETARNMTAAARQMLAVLRDPASVLPGVSAPALQETFDLQELMRSVHDSVAAAAENNGIALAWYMPPYLPSFYSGEYQALDAVLRELLESAVRATRQGAVHFSVRRVPDSDDPGHLLFTVQDSGSGTPPAERSSLALSHVWELAGRSNGFLSAECGIRGATIAFTLHLEPVEGIAEAGTAGHADKTARRARILVCTPGAMDRQALVHMLDGLACVVLQARTLPEALALHEQRPVTMLIAAGSQVSVKAQDMLERFRQRATTAHLPVFGAIAVTGDDSQWDALAKAGFTHALLEPVDREALRQTVREILEAFFGSQGEAGTPMSEGTSGHPAGFPPLSGLLSSSPRTAETERDRTATLEPVAEPVESEVEMPAEDVVPEAETSAEETLPAPEEVRPHDAEREVPVAAADADAARGEETSSAVEDASEAIPQQAETATAAAPAEAGEAEELSVPDKQRETATAPAEETLSADTPQGEAAAVSQVQHDEAAFDEPEETAMPEMAGQDAEEALQTETATVPSVETAVSGASAVPSGIVGTEQETESALTTESAAERTATQATEHPAPQAESAPAPSEQVAATGAASEPSVASEPSEVAPAAPAEAPAAVVSDETPAVSPLSESPASSAATPAQAAPLPASGEFLEWVGEPTPIPSSRPREEAARKPAASSAASASGDAAQPLTLTMQEALKAAEQAQTEAPAAENSEESGSSVPSLLRRVLGRLQGQGEHPATPSGPQTGRARAAEARRRATIKASAARSATSDVSVGDVPSSSVSASSTPVAVSAPTPVPPAPSPAVPPAPQKPTPPEAAVTVAAPSTGSGAGEADQEMLDLVARFDAAVRKAQQAFANGNCLTVAVAAESIARDADAYGFRSLGRMARCVEQAGRHEDLGALRDLLPDLVAQVERNRIAIQKELR